MRRFSGCFFYTTSDKKISFMVANQIHDWIVFDWQVAISENLKLKVLLWSSSATSESLEKKNMFPLERLNSKLYWRTSRTSRTWESCWNSLGQLTPVTGSNLTQNSNRSAWHGSVCLQVLSLALWTGLRVQSLQGLVLVAGSATLQKLNCSASR